MKDWISKLFNYETHLYIFEVKKIFKLLNNKSVL